MHQPDYCPPMKDLALQSGQTTGSRQRGRAGSGVHRLFRPLRGRLRRKFLCPEGHDDSTGIAFAKRSEFGSYDKRAFLERMNDIEEGWGGGSTIGGAPRGPGGRRRGCRSILCSVGFGNKPGFEEGRRLELQGSGLGAKDDLFRHRSINPECNRRLGLRASGTGAGCLWVS